MNQNIFITGFSGTGKSTTCRLLARMLDWRFVDTDDVIVKRADKPIQHIFTQDGEQAFRELERVVLADVVAGSKQVVATGGGIVMDSSNRAAMDGAGLVVLLEASPENILERLQRQRSQDAEVYGVRPMLEAEDPLERIRSLKALRQPNYVQAHWTVETDDLTPNEVAVEVLRRWNAPKDVAFPMVSDPTDTDLTVRVCTSSGDYPLWVGWGAIDDLGSRVREVLDPPVAYIISDGGARSQARRAQMAMEAVDVPTHVLFVPQGERSKNLQMAQMIYSWLADRKAERGHLLLAVGGGVVGDLAGFVASTYLRGMPFGQVPTSLLAMMDAAIGGKTAVDLPQGKNLVGAFYQPKFVLSDVSVLQTLPRRELNSGWAEAIKHGLILDEALLTTFENGADEIPKLRPEITTEVVRRSAAIKADIVSRDEWETLGLRVLLNYGHTIGHAIETATDYERYLHGEAVSIGMMGAAHIGQAIGLMSSLEVERQQDVLARYGLPLTCSGVDPDAIGEAMLTDKKTAAGAIRWVLLDGIGNAMTRNDILPELVRDVVRRLVD
ncbi:3-dehydroquinate synthase [Dehalococcoidia bacterium]|nr:3-dehydroquinate synthase [Dehalococcoidia bacterium]